jgi:hypothetical protein
MHSWSDEHLKSAIFIYQQLELAVARSSAAPACAAHPATSQIMVSLPSPPARLSKTPIRIEPQYAGSVLNTV